MPTVSLASAFLVGVILECVLYGIFVCLLIASFYVQWERYSKRGGVNRVMAFATVFFGFTVTTSFVLNLCRVIQVTLLLPPGVTIYQAVGPAYATVELARSGVFHIQIVVADILMVYRMYHIYDRNPYICIVPSLGIVALFSVSWGLVNQSRDLTTPAGQIARNYWSCACFSLSIFNCLFTSVAISVKLWSVHRETAKADIRTNNSAIFQAMKALIESAALWTSFVAMNFLAYLAGSNTRVTFLAMTNPVVGISFCLIIARLGRILPEARDETWHTSRTPSSRMPGSDQSALSFAQVKVHRDVFVSGSSGSGLDTLVSQKRDYADNSDEIPRVIRASLSLPAPTRESASNTPV